VLTISVARVVVSKTDSVSRPRIIESMMAREGVVKISLIRTLTNALIAILFVPLMALGQSGVPVASQSAIQAQEIAALCPQGPITDVQLTGTASWTMGSDNLSGQVSLKARASGQSRIDLALGSVTRSEIRINDPGNPLYETLEAGQWTTHAIHNSLVDANWFFPAVSALVVGSQNGFLLGTISDPIHIYSQFQVGNQKPAVSSEVQSLSSALYDLDPASHLPTALHFLTHPDDNLLTNIPIDVLFSDYRVVSGVQVPFRIQRFLNGTLQLDITISSVSINPGLTDSDFATN
jgi:hypothetical protein